MGELACKTKIIIDGGNAVGLAESICEATQNLSDEQVANLTDAVAYPIIQELIKAEKALTRAQNLLLDAVKYDGPRP
jgi:hypothetical protein